MSNLYTAAELKAVTEDSAKRNPQVFENEVELFDNAVAEGQSTESLASILGVSADDITWDETDTQKYWLCEECGHTNSSRPMPADRAKFYARVAERGSPKCPQCKSVGFMPVGF